MAGKGSKDNRVKNRKQYRENLSAVKFPKLNNEGFVKIKGKLTKRY